MPSLSAARQTRAIVTLEEHSILGGLGSAVAEVLAEADGVRVPFRRIGLPPRFLHTSAAKNTCWRSTGSTPFPCYGQLTGIPGDDLGRPELIASPGTRRHDMASLPDRTRLLPELGVGSARLSPRPSPIRELPSAL